jgi:hypothetical protein
MLLVSHTHQSQVFLLALPVHLIETVCGLGVPLVVQMHVQSNVVRKYLAKTRGTIVLLNSFRWHATSVEVAVQLLKRGVRELASTKLLLGYRAFKMEGSHLSFA